MAAYARFGVTGQVAALEACIIIIVLGVYGLFVIRSEHGYVRLRGEYVSGPDSSS